MKNRRLAHSLIGSGLLMATAGLVGLVAVAGDHTPVVIYGWIILGVGAIQVLGGIALLIGRERPLLLSGVLLIAAGTTLVLSHILWPESVPYAEFIAAGVVGTVGACLVVIDAVTPRQPPPDP